ncbi:MAG: S41 family peptidase [Bdellovibrionota bacterium]
MFRKFLSKKIIFRLILSGYIASFAFFYAPNAYADKEQDADIYGELKIFTDVLSIIKKDYVQKIDAKSVIEGAIKGMLSTLDPHSGYLDPDFYKDLQVKTKGEFGGLGIEITVQDGLLYVVSPMDDSPAKKAGVRAGDVIVKIDGEFAKNLSLIDAVKKLRGPKGSYVVITVSREGVKRLLDLKVRREIITVDSVKSLYLGDGFGYIRLTQFMEKTTEDLKEALASFKKEYKSKKLKGLILDLRNNPGGLLEQAVNVVDLFLDDGVIVYTDGRVKNQKQKFYATKRDTEPDYPIVVLINGGSASASEIVAAALKDHGRALILGTKSFGKGSVQTITPLSNGGAITLTTALYYTKSENSIQAKGVEPDIIIEDNTYVHNNINDQEEAEPLEIKEKDLPGAIKNPEGDDGADTMRKLNNTPKVENVFDDFDIEKATIDEIFERDGQLKKAYELLKTFNLFGRQSVINSANGKKDKW